MAIRGKAVGVGSVSPEVRSERAGSEEFPGRPASATVTALLCLPVVLTAGCGDPPATGWAGEVRDSAGVTIVVNPAAATVPAVNYLPALTIGNDERVPETLFGNVAGAAVDTQGRIHVLDQQARTVRVFDAEGRYESSLGGPGQGPGELGQLATSIVALGDTIVVADWVNARLTRWGPGQELLPDIALPVAAPARSWWRREADGGLWFRALRRTLSAENQWSGEDWLFAWNPDSGAADSILEFSYTETDIGARGAPRLPPVVNVPLWSVMPDGNIALGDMESGDIRIVDRAGQTVRLIRVEGEEPTPPDAAARTALTQALRDRLSFLGGDPSAVDNLPLDYPAVLPVWTQLHARPDGRLWAQRRGSVADVHPMSLNTPDPPVGWGGGEWYVFDPQGRLERRLELPARSRLLEAEGPPEDGPASAIPTGLLVVSWDANGVETLARLRPVTEPAEGGTP